MKKLFLLFLGSFLTLCCFKIKVQHQNFNKKYLFYGATYEKNSFIGENIDYEFNSLTYDYFSKLSFFPRNENDCCGYVAMTMLLSYCNYIYDDDFIGPNFEKRPNLSSSSEISSIVNSPGTYDYINATYFPSSQNLLPVDIDSGQAFANAFYQTNPNCFMAYLYDFAYNNASSETEYAWGLGYGFQTNGEIVYKTLKSYLEARDSVLDDDYILYGNDLDGDSSKDFNTLKSLCNLNEELYMDDIKALIDAGFPVLVGGYTENGTGHMAIAYAYDSTGLIVNAGYYNSAYEDDNVENPNTDYRRISFSNYKYIATYYAIVPATKQFLIDWDFAPYYQIQLSPTTYANYYHPLLNTHRHCGVNYAYMDTSQHIVTCYCDAEFYEEHNMQKISATKSLCKKCGYFQMS